MLAPMIRPVQSDLDHQITATVDSNMYRLLRSVDRHVPSNIPLLHDTYHQQDGRIDHHMCPENLHLMTNKKLYA